MTQEYHVKGPVMLMLTTTASRFVDHIPYYRQETINARSGRRGDAAPGLDLLD